MDAERLPAGRSAAEMASALIAGGATLLQYRNKNGSSREVLRHALEIRAAAPAGVTLIMNDRSDLCIAAGFNGVHLGQDDLSPTGARMLVGPPLLIGASTHNDGQVKAADSEPVDYIAIGPVFTTGSKKNPDPVVGLEGVRRARKLTRKPLVAIGGITRANCGSVIEAGADSVAVISDLLDDPQKQTEEFIRILG